MSLYTHPIAAKAEAWWKQHGGRHDSPEWNAMLRNVAAKLPAKLSEMAEEHTNDGRYGMSKAGGCTRSATLKLLRRIPEPLTGSTRFTFALGHLVEVIGGLCTLEALGYPVRDLQKPAIIDPIMHSQSDGIFDLDAVPTLLSVKSIGYKMSGRTREGWKRYGFAALPLDGIAGSKPDYLAQAQAEMHAHGLTQALVLVVAKDLIKAMENDPIMKSSGSLSFYAELIPYDPILAASIVETWTEQWGYAQAGEPGPAKVFTTRGRWVEMEPAVLGKDSTNKARTGTFNYCDYCDLVDACKDAIIDEQRRNAS